MIPFDVSSNKILLNKLLDDLNLSHLTKPFMLIYVGSSYASRFLISVAKVVFVSAIKSQTFLSRFNYCLPQYF